MHEIKIIRIKTNCVFSFWIIFDLAMEVKFEKDIYINAVSCDIFPYIHLCDFRYFRLNRSFSLVCHRYNNRLYNQGNPPFTGRTKIDKTISINKMIYEEQRLMNKMKESDIEKNIRITVASMSFEGLHLTDEEIEVLILIPKKNIDKEEKV